MTLLLKVKADYLLVYLAKHNQGSDWSHITHAEKVCTVFRYALKGNGNISEETKFAYN